ncbi:MAG: ATP-binding protein [bacterium]
MMSGDERMERRGLDRRSAARRSTQAVLRHIVDRLPDGIVVVAGHGTIRFVNPAAEVLFGRPARELIGQEFGYALTGPEAAEIEIVRRGRAPVVAELRVVEAVWDDESAALVALRDVTDRKRAEEHERQLERERAARAEAEAANQAKTEFLAVMSHELRTPLNAVLGYAELLDLGVAGAMSVEQRQQVARISASGKHLLGLVNEILDLAKVEAGRLIVVRVPTSVAQVVDSAIVLAQPLAEARGITLHAAVGIPDSLRVLCDPERTLQILSNLLSNAVKFSEPGADIRLGAECVAAGAASRHLHGDGPWAAIRVTDTGIGIDDAQRDAIFAPFVQVEGGHTRRTDGSGLGLTISRRLARLMRGDLTVESVNGAGSTFSLWLPAAPDEAPSDVGAIDRVGAATSQRGIGEVGDALLREIERILDAFVSRLRHEATMPAAATLKHTQLVDHIGCLLADVASALISIDEANGSPTTLLADAADVQRFIADRHGSQRARLGWSPEALEREAEILREEVEASIRRCFPTPATSAMVAEAIGVTRRFLEQAADASRRAHDRTQRAQMDDRR